MEEKPKRRWFRFHLSTAIALMLTGSAYLAFEMTPIRAEKVRPKGETEVTEQDFGWPMVYAKRFPEWGQDLLYRDMGTHFVGAKDAMFRWPFIKSVLLNFVVGICLVFVVALFCEFFIHRRDNRNA